ncbi:MAG TPA: hypothetical protein VFQ61_04790 [Polyangiaceae bacterium]|nr:hypothetical protein [Polyangiaceae bacterium]
MTIRSRRFAKRSAWAVAAGLLPLFQVASAMAAPCADLQNPVFVSGSSAVQGFLKEVARELVAQDITVVYQSGGSCVGVNNVVGGTPLTGTATTWDAAGNVVNCDLADDVADIGISDVYASTCGVNLPSGVQDFFGPVQAMTFVVPPKSTHASISAEAAYLTFGLGDDGETPWSDYTKYIIRSASSGTQQMLSAAITVPAANWKATDANRKSGSGDVVTAITAANATQAEADLTIGILSTDAVAKNSDKVKVLAYQHFGQSCGYLPDSSSSRFDKQNVRDGHYYVWGPLHMLSPVKSGKPANANAKVVIDYLSGAADPAGFDLIQLEAKGGVVPACAMRVSRTTEVGPLSSFMPERSCECKFVREATGTAPAGCETCENNSDCPSSAPACNYGYCEVQ